MAAGNLIEISGVSYAYDARHPVLSAIDMVIPRGKVVGGSSALNGTLFTRALPEDFNSWAAAGNDQWSFDKVLPYLRKLESDLDFHDDFHGSGGNPAANAALCASFHPTSAQTSSAPAA